MLLSFKSHKKYKCLKQKQTAWLVIKLKSSVMIYCPDEVYVQLCFPVHIPGMILSNFLGVTATILHVDFFHFPRTFTRTFAVQQKNEIPVNV